MGKHIRQSLYGFYKFGIIPVFFYFIIFCSLTFPLIFRFFTHFFADEGDGLQNVWNLWWVNKAITQLHCSPWYTTYLHYPYGISLVCHTLNLFNGLMGIFLLKFMTLTAAYNFIVIFSFVIGGLTAFLLAYYITQTYWGSIIAGFVFTFSNYHFMHAEGHLQLVSLEWIPLFMLCFYILTTKPGIIIAIVSALVLYAVTLCDYYYFFYCILSALVMIIWYVMRKGTKVFFSEKHLIPLLIFIAVMFSTSGIIMLKLLSLIKEGPLLGAHSSKVFSTDLLAPFIPGGHWRFADWTRLYWSRLPAGINESSVYVGISVICTLLYVWVKRHVLQIESLRFWYFLLLLFFILSLGPALHVGGIHLHVVMPYALLEIVFPFIKLSGCPVRMMVMVMLSAAIICAMGFKIFFQNTPKKYILLGLLLTMLFFEYLPKPIPSSNVIIPNYVKELKKLPYGGVLDLITAPGLSLYYQTVHEKPMALGYLARIPASVDKEDQKLMKVFQNGKFSKLAHDYNLRYLIGRQKGGSGEVIYDISRTKE